MVTHPRWALPKRVLDAGPYALKVYLALRKGNNGPLFQFADGSPVSRSFFTQKLRAVLEFNRFNTQVGLYKTHSFRIGAASDAATRGVPTATIQQMGRWKSDALKNYIRIHQFTVWSACCEIKMLSYFTRLSTNRALEGCSMPAPHYFLSYYKIITHWGGGVGVSMPAPKLDFFMCVILAAPCHFFDQPHFIFTISSYYLITLMCWYLICKILRYNIVWMILHSTRLNYCVRVQHACP